MGNAYKHEQQKLIIEYIKKSGLMQVRNYPVEIAFIFYEMNTKRDIDNVSGWAHKCILDALVKEGILVDDSWKYVKSIKDEFYIDKDNPRIIVTITERDDFND